MTLENNFNKHGFTFFTSWTVEGKEPSFSKVLIYTYSCCWLLMTLRIIESSVVPIGSSKLYYNSNGGIQVHPLWCKNLVKYLHTHVRENSCVSDVKGNRSACNSRNPTFCLYKSQNVGYVPHPAKFIVPSRSLSSTDKNWNECSESFPSIWPLCPFFHKFAFAWTETSFIKYSIYLLSSTTVNKGYALAIVHSITLEIY